MNELLARLRALSVEMRKHSNDHLRDPDPILRAQAAVEGVCADRLDAVLPKQEEPIDFGPHLFG